MKFISIKAVNDTKLEYESREFDSDFFCKPIREEEEGLYSMKFKRKIAGSTIGLPFDVDYLVIYVNVTNIAAYISMVADFSNDEDYIKYEGYTTDGLIEFAVQASNSEIISMLANIIRCLA